MSARALPQYCAREDMYDTKTKQYYNFKHEEKVSMSTYAHLSHPPMSAHIRRQQDAARPTDCYDATMSYDERPQLSRHIVLVTRSC
jgi:hypothetical protein